MRRGFGQKYFGFPTERAEEPQQEGSPDSARSDVSGNVTRLDAVRPEFSQPESSDVGSHSHAFEIYTDHFGMVERPFSLVPDPDYIYWSREHERAFTMLEYGILTRAPITLITGEIGAGKTTLIQHLLQSLGPDTHVGLISNAHGSRGELLRWVLMALDQAAPQSSDYVELFATFQRYLISEYAKGHNVVLIFDEAQNLSPETLEELRMFTNINSGKDELLQLVLVGQPELRAMIQRPELLQFSQRVAASFHLKSMDRSTVRKYISHRLEVAGGDPAIFSPAAATLIYEATGGVPRLVNQLCDLALVYAFTGGARKVSKARVAKVLSDGAFFSSNRYSDIPRGGMGQNS